jgi:hypothetical protein
MASKIKTESRDPIDADPAPSRLAAPVAVPAACLNIALPLFMMSTLGEAPAAGISLQMLLCGANHACRQGVFGFPRRQKMSRREYAVAGEAVELRP